MRVNFQEIKRSREVHTFCTACKKRLRRSISESQTINPWNRNELGIPKNALEIHEELTSELRGKAALLEKNGTVCRKCEDVQ